MSKFCHNSALWREGFLRSAKRMATLTFRIPVCLIRRVAPVRFHYLSALPSMGWLLELASRGECLAEPTVHWAASDPSTAWLVRFANRPFRSG
jgi:hypothetical protein